MQKHLYLLFVLMIVVFGKEPATIAETQQDRAREIGQMVAQKLQDALKTELMSAMKQGGPAAAIEVCSRKAQVLTAQVAGESGIEGITIKRTSLRYRNPKNRPDSEEQAVLEEFEMLHAKGEKIAPRLIAQGESYRYFAPILVGGLCQVCHGPPERIGSDVKAILDDRYPLDMAVGFVKGDLRGVFSVTIPKSAMMNTAR